MSYVIATPEMMATAAFDLARIGSQVSAASAVAAMPTTEVVAAGADEVSAGIAALFSAHAQEYQALSAQAAAFHDQFVHTLTAVCGVMVTPWGVRTLPHGPSMCVASLGAVGLALLG